MEKLKVRWGIQSNVQLTLILVTFAVTGTTAARCAAPIVSWLGINSATSPAWLYWPLQLILIMPLYQVLLLVVGSLFGQFRFFLAFEKRMLARCGISFGGSGAASGAVRDAGRKASMRSDKLSSDDTSASADHHAEVENQFAG